MIGAAAGTRHDWYAHFNSPILARLAYWKGVNDQREARERMDEQNRALLDDLNRQRENLRADPNLRIRVVPSAPDWMKQ